jgi:hypothetical protein
MGDNSGGETNAAPSRRIAGRCTIVVHTALSGHMARVEAARRGESGVQVMTMGWLAARLAGGFFRPIDEEALQEAVRAALPGTDLGELERIKHLPGMARAATTTLDKVWRAGIELASHAHPRLKALAALERAVLSRLPPAMKRPGELVALAAFRIAHAPAVLGPIEVHGHSEMAPCWRPLLAKAVPVVWVAGRRPVPAWLEAMGVEVRRDAAAVRPTPTLFSCAHPQHEALEAFRWMRELMASGRARPEEIAIAAASPADFDDHLMALCAETGLRVHFAGGIKAVSTRDGQRAAALAEILVKGLSQQRVRRLFTLLAGVSKAIADLPRDWTRVLPADAPLTRLERWDQVFAAPARDWPGGVDRSALVLGILRLLAKGPDAAVEAGEYLLEKLALTLWRRALKDGPPAALPVTLTHLRIEDGVEPACHPIWCSAIALASAPRPHVRLLALNAGRWPRRISEDRLIPDYIIPTDELDPLPISEADRRDFATIIASARSTAISFSRRDVEGRLLGRSPLIGASDAIYLGRGRTPPHAASESDRLLARPAEFGATAIARSGRACWRDWWHEAITAHDGLVGRQHPRLRKVFEQPASASSLKLLLRDPLRFAWRYALGWREPQEADEPLMLDALAFGNLLHETLQTAVDAMEVAGGFATATTAEINRAIARALRNVAADWEREQPVPPPLLWRSALEEVTRLAAAALNCELDRLPGQMSWTEVPFGAAATSGRNDLPWDPSRRVEIPGTGLCVAGHIDRLDLSGDRRRARVIDYKTGKPRDMSEITIEGGRELQRCLYAFAVKTLLGRGINVDAALLYVRAHEDEGGLFPLADVDGALATLAAGIRIARNSLEQGLALPGTDVADRFNDFKLALPASPSYLNLKKPLAEEKLGAATKIWEAT